MCDTIHTTDISQTLIRFGLTNAQADVFLAISALGSGTAKEISVAAGKERAQTHHILRDLQALGIVEVLVARPTRFRAVNASDAVNQLISIQTNKVHALEELKDELVQNLSSSTPPLIEKPETYSIVMGRTNTYLKMVSEIRASERSVSLLLSANGLARVARLEDFAGALSDGGSKGVSIRVLTEITEANLGALARFENLSEIRHIKNQVANASAYDNRIASIALSLHDDLKAESNTHIAVWASSESFVTTLNNFFDSVWSQAEPAPKAAKLVRESQSQSPSKAY